MDSKIHPTLTQQNKLLCPHLSSGVATIESLYAKHRATFPSKDEPFQPGPFDNDVALRETIDRVIAAASQLIAIIRPTPRTAVESAFLVCDHVCKYRVL
jgi:hypothetical protein